VFSLVMSDSVTLSVWQFPLQHTATHYNTLLHTATLKERGQSCNVAVCCNVLQCVAVCCSVLQCVAERTIL